jgi:parallel beta-helix repeat protein
MALVPPPTRRSLALAPLLLVSILAACGSDPTDATSTTSTPLFEGRTRSRPTPTTLLVEPASARTAPGQGVTFTAVTTTSAGDTTVVAVDWSVSGGTITSDGLFTADAAGTFSVVGKTRGRNKRADTATVVVQSVPLPAPIRLQVSPASATVTAGTQRTFVAQGILADSSVTSVAATWSATGGSIAAGGTYTAGATPGTYEVTATDEAAGLADTVAVIISAAQPTLQAVVLTPSTTSLQTGGSKTFTAVGRMSDSSTATIPVRYTATGGTISSSGTYTAGTTPGTYRVVAADSSGSLADTASVTIVTPTPTLTAVVLTPTNVSLQAGASQQFAASGKYSDGSTGQVTVTYGATGGTVSTSGLYQAGQSAGTYRVVATQSGGTLADTAQVTITTASPPPPSEAACSGIAVPAGSSIQNAVNAAAQGATLCLGAGTYQNQTVSPKAGQQLVGARGAAGERLSVMDGGGTVTSAFVGSVANVRIEGLVIRNYFGGSGGGVPTTTPGMAIENYGSTGWQIVDNEIANNSGAGLRIANSSTTRRNFIHHNGWLGASCGGNQGSNAVVDSNEVSYNNTRGIDPNWGAGGIKCVLTSNLTFRGNFVHHNTGQGLWCDNCAATTYYLGNRVEDNTHNGIYHEVSQAAVIDGNTVSRNGSASCRSGIAVDNSANVEIRNNVVRGPNCNGLILLRQVSRPENPAWQLANVYVHHNDVTMVGGEFAGCVQFVNDPSFCSSSRSVRYDWNTYHGTVAFRWNANGNITWAQWRSASQDANGAVVP